jgi:ribosome-associated protein
MIRINPNISLQDQEVSIAFVRSGGPGGQNVNKVATAAQLRFDAANCPAISPSVMRRLTVLAGRRMTADGILLIEASEHRTQNRNRQAVLERLTELIARAAVAPKPRRKTKPTKASNRRRLEGKKMRSGIKTLRGTIDD